MSSPYSEEQLASTQFELNKRLIDASRSIIEVNGTRHTVEPKVMQVLVVLAANAGSVVEQEALFAKVWPGSIFSSGSVRRCVAILRKMLNDAGAETDVITTHPKKGYSLNGQITLKRQSNKTSKVMFGVLAACVLLFSVLALTSYTWSDNEEFLIDEAYPVTSSEHQEFNAILSPDGTKVGFFRIEAPDNNNRALWYKDLSTEQEYKVKAGNMREFTWSPSSSKIAYVTRQNAQDVIHQVSLGENPVSRIITSFNNQRRISSLHWGADEKLYSLIKQNNALKLIAVDVENANLEVLKTFAPSFTPYGISVSLANNRIAVIGFDENGRSQIKTFSRGESDLNHIVTLNENRYFFSWHPQKDLLLVSDGRLMNTLDLRGNLARVNYENFDFIQRPQFTPDGQGIILSQGKFDTDIVLGSFDENGEVRDLINTNTVDRSASLSPDKTRLAFISHRKGFPQVYLLDITTGRTRLIYENSERLLGISKPVWHPGGERLGFSNYEFPVIVSLTDEAYSVETYDKPMGIVVDWYRQENALLTVSYNRNTVQKVDLASKSERVIRPLDGLRPVLGADEHLLFAKGTELVSDDGDKNTRVINLNERVLRLVKGHDELLITTEKDKERHLLVFDLLSNKVTAKYTLPERAFPVLAQLDGKLVYETTRKQKDIIYLKRL